MKWKRHDLEAFEVLYFLGFLHIMERGRDLKSESGHIAMEFSTPSSKHHRRVYSFLCMLAYAVLHLLQLKHTRCLHIGARGWHLGWKDITLGKEELGYIWSV